MRLLGLWTLLALLTFCCSSLLVVCSADEAADELDGSQTPVRASFKLARLLDFSKFKEMFRRKYSGVGEELVRKKYFFSRACRAFISAIKYKFRLSTSYLAVNNLSDRTPGELLQSANRLAPNKAANPLLAEAKWLHEREEELLPVGGEAPEMELKQLVASAQKLWTEEAVKTIAQQELGSTGETQTSMKELADAKKPPAMVANRKEVEFYETGPGEQKASLFERINTLLTPNSWLKRRADKRANRVFVDHRRSGCMSPIREQGACGSCYAFAAIAVFEYLYCKQTGQLRAFSEQYVLDCGREYVAHISGCDGGSKEMVAEFVNNYGLELRDRYPYAGHDSDCPYSSHTDIKRTGHFRFNVSEALMVAIDRLEEFLEYGPMTLSIYTPGDFHEYGGGVHQAAGCVKQPYAHVMVLIGHGREDGHDYWLMRNSHGLHWGEQGHYRLSKKADCWEVRFGLLYATKDGPTGSRSKFQENPLYEHELIDAHRAKLIASSQTSSKIRSSAS